MNTLNIKALIVAEGAQRPAWALVDVLGASLAERTAHAMLDVGIGEVWVISPQGEPEHVEWPSPRIHYQKGAAGKLWEDAEGLCAGLADADVLLLVRMSAYAEVDWVRFAQRHLESGARVTRAWASEAHALDVYAVHPKQEKEVAFLFHAHLSHTRLEASRYLLGDDEYAQPLTGAQDIRQIAKDALHLAAKMRPVGTEVRPGVWIAERGRVDQGARLVAPVYVGRFARIRAGAVVTRGSAVERHACVDCGTVVEDATVLPFTVVGAGLDVTRAVVSGRNLMDLRRNIAVEIHDPTLLHELAHNAGVRVLSKAASLASYLPLQFWRGMTQPAALPAPAAALPCAADFAATVIKENAPAAPPLRPELVMERYGNQ